MKSTTRISDGMVRLARMIEARRRITALIPTHPRILNIQDKPHDLFKIQGFDISDLELTEAEINHALATAIDEWKEEHRN